MEASVAVVFSLAALLAAISMLSWAIRLYSVADNRLVTEEKVAEAVAALSANSGADGYVKSGDSCEICAWVTASYYILPCGDGKAALLWPDG